MAKQQGPVNPQMLPPLSPRPLGNAYAPATNITGHLEPLIPGPGHPQLADNVRGTVTSGWPGTLLRGFGFAVLPRPTVPVNVIRGARLTRNG